MSSAPSESLSKRLNIRVDSSSRIGSGHVSRCIAIAEEAVSLGHSVRFLSRTLVGSQTEPAVADNFEYVELLGESKFESRLGPIEVQWPEAEQIRDAQAVNLLLSRHNSEVLLVDHYGLGETFSQHLSVGSERLYFIHDFETANCSSECIHPGITSPIGLASKIFEGNVKAKYLLEQSLVPLSKEVRKSRSDKRSRRSREESNALRVFVDLGTSGVSSFIGTVDKALSLVAEKVSITASCLQPRRPDRNGSEHGTDGCFIPHESYFEFGSQGAYLDFVQTQDLVIGAGGVSCLERLYLGVPQIVFSISENQIRLAKSLSDWNAIHWGGPLKIDSPQELSEHLIGAIENIEQLGQIAKMGQLQIDGFGSRRIAQLLFESPPPKVTIRKSKLTDAPLLFGWANDPQLRRNSISREVVNPQEHWNWFEEALRSPDQEIYILESESMPLGQARFRRRFENEFVLSYSIDPVYRGGGLAKELLSRSVAAHKAAFPDGVYHATIRGDNPASRAALIALGFRVVENEKDFQTLVLS